MKSRIIIVALLLICQFSQAQKLICKDGHIWFYSHTGMEDIEAHNYQVVAVLDQSNGELIFTLLIKSFSFKKKLMQEHFNENYMESDTYPKAGFKGNILDFDKIDLNKDGKHEVTVSGELTIHGVTKKVSIKGMIEIANKVISAKSDFVAMPSDYNISIPDLVKDNIAKEIEVHVDVTFNN